MGQAGAQPLAVLMGGAPGSGKTTLAYELGRRLRLPVLSKDELRQSTLWALGTADVKEAPWGPGPWFGALEGLLSARMSVVGDMTLFRGESDQDVRSRLAPVARLVQVHCRCADPLGRWKARVEADPLRAEDLDHLLPLVTSLCADLEDPVDVGCPCLVVDTDDGYDPPIAEIVASIVRDFGPHLSALATGT